MKMLKKAMNNERTAGIIFTMPFTIGFLLFMICLLYTSCCALPLLFQINDSRNSAQLTFGVCYSSADA